MRRKQLISALLACMLVFSCSFIPATAVEAAEIQGLFPHPAGAEALAGLPVLGQNVPLQGLPAQLYWCDEYCHG